MMQALVEPLVAAVPWKWRRAFYRSPLVARMVRASLNRLMGADRRIATVTGGPLRGVRLELDLRSEKHFWLGTHETEVQSWIVDKVKPGWVVYDIGANLGYFTALLSRVVGTDGRVIAFEPDPYNTERLRRTVDLNALRNVQLEVAAVTDRGGSIDFVAGRDTVSTVRLRDIDGPEEGEVMSVPAVTIDDLVEQQRCPSPQLIKIDVEGHEVQVLEGAVQVLKSYHPLILCEVHSAESANSVLATLSTSGYDMYHLEQGSPALSCTTTRISHGHVLGI